MDLLYRLDEGDVQMGHLTAVVNDPLDQVFLLDTHQPSQVEHSDLREPFGEGEEVSQTALCKGEALNRRKQDQWFLMI